LKKPAGSSVSQRNYLVDMLLAFLGAMSGITGIVLLLMGQGGGYHGGRNPYFVRSFLGIERHTWSDLHTWVSILEMDCLHHQIAIPIFTA